MIKLKQLIEKLKNKSDAINQCKKMMLSSFKST